MIALVKKEIQAFFASPIAYLVIGLFLVLCWLFLFVFSGPYNIFDTGFADLSGFFELAPWILLFLVPAVSMRSFSEEIKLGTLELLLTRPLALRQIVLGKYFGVVLLIVLAVAPTLLYIITIDYLGLPPGNWDLGSTVGAYFGLLFLILAYASVGLFSSSLSSNQIVSFIIAAFGCFVLYFGFEALGELLNSSLVINLGLKAHFDSIARGVVDTRDLVYFISVAALFLTLTHYRLESKR